MRRRTRPLRIGAANRGGVLAGRRTINSLLVLLALGGASYLILWAADVLPKGARVDPGSTPKDAWSLVLDFGVLLLAVIAGLVLGLVALSLLAAGVLRLPFVGTGVRWLARQKWGEEYFGEKPGKRWLRRRAGTVVEITNWFVGYDLVVDDFQPSIAGNGSPTAIATGATDGSLPADPYGELANDATTAAAVRSVLGSSGVPAAPGGVDYVRSSAQAKTVLNAVADAMKEVQELKWLAPLLRLGRTVMPRQTYTIEGHLFPAGERGRGLAMALVERGGDVRSTVTLWERTFDPKLGLSSPVADRPPTQAADALYRLGVGAAGWIVYEVMSAQEDDEEGRERLKAGNWESYAYFLAGVECQQGYQWAKAEALYARALERDGGNLPALFNIAVINTRGRGARKPEAASFDHAIERLEWLCATIEKRPGGSLLRRNPLWYQAAYNLAAAQLEQSLLPEEKAAEAKNRWCAAYKVALELARDLESALLELEPPAKNDEQAEPPEPKHKAEAIAEVLERVEAPSLLLLADVASRLSLHVREKEVRCKDGDARAQLLARLKAPPREAEAGKLPKDSEDLAEYIVRYVRKDGESPAPLSYRAHYNLACYYTARAEQDEDAARRDKFARTALGELRYAVEAGNITQWVEQDPTLGWLREHRGADVDRILAPYHPKRGSSELGRLRIVGRTLAARLQEKASRR